MSQLLGNAFSAELDWKPKIYLEEGIARLTAWLLEHKSKLQ